MLKRIIQVTLLVASVAFAVWGAVYIKKSGLFDPYPEKEFLSRAEAELRPVYQQLEEDEKALYTAIYRGILNNQKEVQLPFEVDGEVYSKLYMIVEKQESELFFVDSTYYTAMKQRSAQIVYRTDSPEERAEMQSRLEVKAQTILSGISENVGDYEKALYIHDYIVENCRYEVSETEAFDATAYGCLVEGKAHCEGYAKAFSYLLAKCGIRSTVVTGVTGDGENHAWNQVEIDGNWYNCDVTWDDTDVDGNLRHIYFMCTDDEFCAPFDKAEGQVHVPMNNNFELPACVDRNGFYVREGLYISDISQVERVVMTERSNGNMLIELKFADENVYREFKNGYIDSQLIMQLLLNGNVEILYNSVQVTVSENAEERVVVMKIG